MPEDASKERATDDCRRLDLIDLRTCRDESLLHEFYERVYKPAFPIATQREDPSVWTGRLWGEDSEDTTFELHALIVGEDLGSASRRTIYGGCLFEYYGESRTGLLTYMVVVPEARRRRLGSLLYKESVAALRAVAARHGVELAAIFGEVTNPLKSTSAEVMDAWDRLAVMQQWGGRVLDIEYIQPELTPGQGPDRDLLLLFFPQDSRPTPTSLPRESVLAFLREFYETLSCTKLAANQDLDQMSMSMSGDTVQLVTMIAERPVLKFPDYGIALHFVKISEDHEAQSDSLNGKVRPASKVFESFEHDLIAYSFRHTPPFRSVSLESTRELEVEILFPPYLDFVSEGRTWRLCARQPGEDSRRVWTRVVPSKTVFGTGFTIYNMVLTSCNLHDRTPLNEYDIIKLVKLYAPSEEVDGIDRLRVSLEGKRTELSRFLDSIFGESAVNLSHLRAGTVQLLTPDERSEDWDQIFGLSELLNSDPSQAIAQIDELIEGDALAVQQLMAINGILTGIFDFHRVDAWEIADVFQSVHQSAEALLYMHKGNVLSVSSHDRPFELAECRSHIGISPYLLLPHAALIYNEEILNTAAMIMPEHGAHGIRRLEAARAEIDKLLNTGLLPNVFQYVSERRMFEYGYRERGLEENCMTIRRGLEWLTRRIEAQARTRERRADIFLQSILGFLTVALLKDIVFELLASYPSWQWPAYIVTVAVVVVVFFVSIFRAGKL